MKHVKTFEGFFDWFKGEKNETEELLLSVLENTISNADSVCNSINGQLKGLKFEGKVEP